MSQHRSQAGLGAAAAALPADGPGPAAGAPSAAGGSVWPHLVVAAVGLVLDQLSKWWAVAALTRPRAGMGDGSGGLAASLAEFLGGAHPRPFGRITVVENFFHLRYVENPGAAWGLLARTDAAWRTPALALVAVVATAVALTSLMRSRPEQRALRAGLGLLLGGAVGNLLDRLRLGYVIDFIDWHWYDVAAWPTFNLADACISVGAGLLMLDFLGELRGGRGGDAAATGK